MDAARPSLSEKLDKIRSPKLQNQRETSIVLSAIEDTLTDQAHGFTPTAYFAALLALLSQAIPSSQGIVNKELATSVVYLLDVVTPYVPAALLRSKFSSILTSLAPALTHPDAEAPLLRSSIGCLESLVIAQDSAAWALPQTEIGPRRAVGGLLTIAGDHRPKVRKAAQDAVSKILKSPPPSPSLDHPVADMCAEMALRSLSDVVQSATKRSKSRGHAYEEHSPPLIHALQLIKTIANASGGWPSKKIDSLCEVLLNISKSNNEYLTMTAFEVFEAMFGGMANEFSSSKLPRLLEVILDLQPSKNDSQLLPPWIAIVSRAYDVSAQVDPDDTFQKLPQVFEMMSGFLSSMSHNIRISASECLISFLASCIPPNAIIEPSVYDEKTLEKLCRTVVNLLSVKYQGAWMEVFNVLTASFDALKWRSAPLLNEAVKTVGELRATDSFNGKREADAVLGKAVEVMGPETVLAVLPLNLADPNAGLPGRAWLLPILRDHVVNTNLAHFKSEFVPLSQSIFQRVVEHGQAEKTMEIKIYETMVQQIWSVLPGYCNLPLDVVIAFDQGFAELLSNILYQQTDLRVDICKALQLLVDTNKELLTSENSEDDLFILARISKSDARRNLEHLASFAENLLAVLFNVYSQTLPQFRGYILRCINAYLGIMGEKEIVETFNRVTTMLESSLPTETSKNPAPKPKQVEKSKDKSPVMPPTSHTLMDLIIALAFYLPSPVYPSLLNLASKILPLSSDPQLQKKAYKLFPRLARSSTGPAALASSSTELQALLLSTSESATSPCKRDRLAALAVIVSTLPKSFSLHFIPSILSEAVIAAKEVNEKARTEAFDLLVLMANTMREGGTIDQAKIPHMGSDAPTTNASLEEFFTMVSAGLAGSSSHMVSASITALTRILYEFRSDIAETMLEDLVSTMELFLSESKNREIVRSVLGFVQVAVISLPDNVMPRTRVNTVVKGLMIWSKEHKNRFRSKVRHIIERMGRRFGWGIVENACPEEDRKFIANIRKMKERSKRKKKAGEHADEADDADGEQHDRKERRRGKFESEFDEAVYGSESDDASDSDASTSGRRGKKKNAGGNRYIVEDEDEPLDLLDRRALGHISSTKPLRNGKTQPSERRNKAKINADGKLVLGDEDDDDLMMNDAADDGPIIDKDTSLESGIGAYVEAIRGRDAAQRGRGGRLKFSNRKDRKGVVEEEEDGGERPVSGKKVVGNETRGGRGTIRRGLGVEKRKGESRDGVRAGRVGGGRVGKRFNTRGGARGGRGGRR